MEATDRDLVPMPTLAGQFYPRQLAFIGGSDPFISLTTDQGHGYILLTDCMIDLLFDELASYRANRAKTQEP